MIISLYIGILLGKRTGNKVLDKTISSANKHIERLKILNHDQILFQLLHFLYQAHQLTRRHTHTLRPIMNSGHAPAERAGGKRVAKGISHAKTQGQPQAANILIAAANNDGTVVTDEPDIGMDSKKQISSGVKQTYEKPQASRQQKQGKSINKDLRRNGKLGQPQGRVKHGSGQ